MTPETRLKTRIIRYLRRRALAGEPIWWTKLHGGAQQQRGLPDLLVVHNGHAVFLEIKAGRAKATKLQAHIMRQIEDVGGTVAVVRSVGDVERAIDTGRRG